MSEIAIEVSVSDAERLILKGIEDAKGSSGALGFLTEEDFTNLGKTLADREALKNTNFFSVVVDPITTINDVVERGHFTHNHLDLSKITLNPKVSGKKRVHFIPVSEVVPEGGEAKFLAKFGKKPLTNAPEYFFGTMATCKETDLPENMKKKDIVATSSEGDGVFLDSDGDRCFLKADRRSGGRELGFVFLDGGWVPEDDWVLLAEDL